MLPLPSNPTARYRKAKSKIGGNGRAWSRPAEPLTPSRFDFDFRSNHSGFRVGERNTREPGHLYWCPSCRRHATYLIKRPATAAKPWECQDCVDDARRHGHA